MKMMMLKFTLHILVLLIYIYQSILCNKYIIIIYILDLRINLDLYVYYNIFIQIKFFLNSIYIYGIKIKQMNKMCNYD